MSEIEIYKNLNMLIFSAHLTTHINDEGEIKKDFKPICKWKEQTKSMININCNCFFVATGKKSNCTIVECDDMTIEKNKDLHALCINYCNLVVKSKKGFHYYFEYTDKLHTTTNIIKSVDIRNDDGCIIIPPTTYRFQEDKLFKKFTYKIVIEPQENEKLKPITQEILLLLQSKEQQKEQPKEQPKDKQLNENTTKTETKKNVIKMTKELMKDILTNLNENRYTDYDLWLKVLFCCKCENTNDYFDEFNEFSKKWNKYNKNDVIKKWNDHQPRTNNTITYNSLLYWLSIDNKQKYDEIITKYNLFNTKEEETENKNLLEINQPYLLNNKKIEKCNVSNHINEFLEKKKLKV